MCQFVHRIIVSLVLFAMPLGRALPAAAPEKSGGQPGDHYYMILFAQERDWLTPRLSHTYAAFMRVSETKTGERKLLETHTISWMPATLDVRLLRGPERGVNLSLKKSLELSQSLDTRISMWGPYQIRQELYDRAVRQEASLKRGRILYKALDAALRPEGEAVNCIHALADIDTDRGMLNTGTAHGEDATLMVAQQLRRWMVNPARTYSWVGDLLGLRNYPIIRRTLNGEIAARK